jgi:hypothetical protein
VMPRSFGIEVADPTLTRKPSKYTVGRPYRKPTQVGR